MMAHAQKYVLVDPVMCSRTHPTATSLAAASVNISKLDSEVRFILDGSEPDDVKAKQYAMVLKKIRVREQAKYENDKVDEIEILDTSNED